MIGASLGLETTNGWSEKLHLLRCLECRERLELAELRDGISSLGPDGVLRCRMCAAEYPISGGTPRMLVSPMGDEEGGVKTRTGESFAYEWEHFGALRTQWRENFRGYVQPHQPDWFDGRLVLDVGTGSGRHSYEAASLGAQLVAVDIGRSIDVARQNLPPSALTVQADAELLPFDPGTFDLVMSIGVLHHLPDPERAFRSIVRFAKPGGYVQIYVYWLPARPSHRRILEAVTAARRLTTRLPYRLLHALCYPLSVGLFATCVLPYKGLRRFRHLRRIADAFPLKTYADYPFRVCVNDQFDRFSAPIERRYTAEQVRQWFVSAGLEDVEIRPHHGWVASGRIPGQA